MSAIRILVLAALFWTVAAPADPQREIEHLLDFVARTSCSYERNGVVYNGHKARDHMQRKYDYFKHRIKTTEEFIKYAATESTLSRQQYKVRCAGEPVMNSRDWLLNELSRYRHRIH